MRVQEDDRGRQEASFHKSTRNLQEGYISILSDLLKASLSACLPRNSEKNESRREQSFRRLAFFSTQICNLSAGKTSNGLFAEMVHLERERATRSIGSCPIVPWSVMRSSGQLFDASLSAQLIP